MGIPSGYVDASLFSTLDAAVAAAIAGGLHGVYIPANTTVVATNSITIPSNFAIVGADSLTSVVHFASLNQDQGFVSTNATNVTFSDFKITADASHSVITWSNVASVLNSGMISVNGGSAITVDNVTVADAPGRAIYLKNVSDSVVTGNHTIDGDYTHISVSGNNNTIENNNINGGQWYGIEVAGTNFLVASNFITRLTGSQSFGITFQGLSASAIKNNNIEFVEHYGMYTDGAGSHDDAIMGNTVRGIGIVDGVRVDESGTGIEIRGGAHDLLVANNSFPDELGYGVAIAGVGFAAAGLPNGADAPNIVVSGNSITGAYDPGIVVTGASHAIIRENFISSPHSMGISIGDEHSNLALATTHSDFAEILNNNIQNNWLEGIWATGISHAVITGNSITGNYTDLSIYLHHQSAGITVMSWPTNAVSSSNLIAENIITPGAGHEQSGVFIAAGQTGNTIEYNDLSGNANGVNDQSGGSTNLTGFNKLIAGDTSLSGAAPIADAGQALSIAPGSMVDLDASSSHFMTGSSPISFHWSQIYGQQVQLAGADTGNATFLAPDINSTALLGFRLTASNSSGSTFDDVYLAIDPSLSTSSGSAATDPNDWVAKLYIGYYGRAADPDGQAYWTSQLPSLSPAQIAQSYSVQAESTSLYPFLADHSLTNTSSVKSFVDAVYTNLFGRAADSIGESYWINQLTTGASTVGGAILDIISGAQESDLAMINNKVDVSDYYVTQLLRSGAAFSQTEAHVVLAGVTSDPVTVGIAEAAIDNYLHIG